MTIIITFTPEQEKKYLEFEFLDKKSNIKDYILKIYDDSNTIIENINGSNLKDRILPKKIISVDKLISKIEIIIISTTDKKPPCRVQISIKGYPTRCESSTKHTTKHLTTSHTTSHTNFKVTSSSSLHTTPRFSSSTRKFYFFYFYLFILIKFFFKAFFCGDNKNITNLTSCYIQTSIFENVVNDKNFIFDSNGRFVTSLNSRLGKITFVFSSPETSFLNLIRFNIVNNAQIKVQINGIYDLVSKILLKKFCLVFNFI